MKSSASSSLVAAPPVSVVIPTNIQKVIIPSAADTLAIQDALSRTQPIRSNNKNSSVCCTPFASFQTGDTTESPSSSATYVVPAALQGLTVTSFIDMFSSTTGENFINKVLIRKEDVGAFSVDVVKTYPAIAEEYEKLCPNMLDLGTMKGDLASTTLLDISRRQVEDGGGGSSSSGGGKNVTTSEPYVSLLIQQVHATLKKAAVDGGGGDGRGKSTGTGAAAAAIIINNTTIGSLPLIVAMFAASSRNVVLNYAANAKGGGGGLTQQSTVTAVPTRAVTRRGGAVGIAADAESVATAAAAPSAFVEEALLEAVLQACSSWLIQTFVETISTRISDQVDLIVANCLTFNSSNSNTFFVDHAKELSTFTKQKALPAFTSRWKDFLCVRWLRHTAVTTVISDLIRQQLQTPSSASASLSSSQQLASSASVGGGGAGSSSVAGSRSSVFKKTTSSGGGKQVVSASQQEAVLTSLEGLQERFDKVAASSSSQANMFSTGPTSSISSASAKQERQRLLQAMISPTPTSGGNKNASSSLPSKSPETVFSVPETIRSFLINKHLNRETLAALFAAESESSSSEHSGKLLGTVFTTGSSSRRRRLQQHSVFASSRSAEAEAEAATVTTTAPTTTKMEDHYEEEEGEVDKLAATTTITTSVTAEVTSSAPPSPSSECSIFVCDAVLEKRFAESTVAQVLEGFYKYKVSCLDNSSSSGDANGTSTPSSYQRAKALHTQSTLLELRELLTLVIVVFEKAVSMPVLLYSYEMSELYQSKWWRDTASVLLPSPSGGDEAAVKVEGDANNNSNKNTQSNGGKRAREGEEEYSLSPSSLVFLSPSAAAKTATSSSTPFAFAEVCSCEYLVRLLVWLPQIVKVMLSGGGSVNGSSNSGCSTSSAQQRGHWAAAALASRVVTPLVEEVLQWINTTATTEM